MSDSAYRRPRKRKRSLEAKKRKEAKRGKQRRARLRRDKAFVLLAGPLAAGEVSMIRLSFDGKPPSQMATSRLVDRFVGEMRKAGLATWGIAVRHVRNSAGHRVRVHVHLICDLHLRAVERLQRESDEKKLGTVKLDHHGTTLAKMLKRSGFGSDTHWRPFDEGGPAYLLGKQWDGKAPWKPRFPVDAFLPPRDGQQHSEILDLARDMPLDRDAADQRIPFLVKSLQHYQAAEEALKDRPEHLPSKPLPKGDHLLLAQHFKPGEPIWRWLRENTISNAQIGEKNPLHRAHQQLHRAANWPRSLPDGRYSYCVAKEAAQQDFEDYCAARELPMPSPRAFLLVMNHLCLTKDGDWIGLALTSDPMRYEERYPGAYSSDPIRTPPDERPEGLAIPEPSAVQLTSSDRPRLATRAELEAFAIHVCDLPPLTPIP